MEYINGILFNHKKWNAAIATTWKDLKGIVLSEMSENKIQHDLSYMESMSISVSTSI